MRRAFAVVVLLLAAASSPSFAEHRKLPPERRVSGGSKLVMRLLESPPPADARDALAVALVLDYAHELDASRALRGYVERQALQSIAGTAASEAPSRVERLASRDPGPAAGEQMRVDVLKLVHAEVLEKEDPDLHPLIAGWVTRHDEGPVWTHTEGEREMNRMLAVSIRNDAAQPLVRGDLSFHLRGLGDRYEFACRIGQVPAHAAANMFCWTIGDVPPLADVYRALERRGNQSPIPAVRMHTAVFTVEGLRFDVTQQSANFENDGQLDDELRAGDLLDRTPCADKGTCVGGFIGSIARSPFMLGFVAGLAAGTLYLVVALGWGERRAAGTGRVISVIASAASVACLVIALVWAAKAGWFYAVVLTAGVASVLASASMGFVLGAAAAIVAGVVAKAATARA